MVERPLTISVVGAGTAHPELYETSRAVGGEIARLGGVVVCGGLGGVMEGACRGAAEAGGRSVAILPGSDAAAANRYASLVIPTGLGHARNVLVVQAGCAVIALTGKEGTLSEVALAIKTGRAVIGLGGWAHLEGVTSAADPAKAAALAMERAQTFRETNR